jgi:hypothetical protein
MTDEQRICEDYFRKRFVDPMREANGVPRPERPESEIIAMFKWLPGSPRHFEVFNDVAGGRPRKRKGSLFISHELWTIGLIEIHQTGAPPWPFKLTPLGKLAQTYIEPPALDPTRFPRARAAGTSWRFENEAHASILPSGLFK